MKGFYLPGALYILDLFRMLDETEIIVGTSVGGLIASIRCLGFTSEDMIDLFMGTEFEELFNELRPSNFFSFGWFCDGEWFETYLSKCIHKKTGKDDITLKELYDICGKTLMMNTVIKKKNGKKVHKIFDYKTDPDLSMIKAVRMTSCIPGFLKPVLYNDEECYDGGVWDNYLIHLFDENEVLGIYLGSRLDESEKESFKFQKMGMLKELPVGEGIMSFINLLWEIFTFVSNELEILRMGGRDYAEIRIPSRGIKMLSFNIDDSRKQQMILDGMRETLQFMLKQSRFK